MISQTWSPGAAEKFGKNVSDGSCGLSYECVHDDPIVSKFSKRIFKYSSIAYLLTLSQCRVVKAKETEMDVEGNSRL